MEETPQVDNLLSTLRIPVYPPDRSQWRKLELAMKFINNSKASAKETKERKESLKIDPKSPRLLKKDKKNPEDSNVDHPVVLSKSKESVRKRGNNWSKIRNSLQEIM